MRFHVVYPCGPQIACPAAIGRHLRACLAPLGEVVVHALDADYTIEPGPDDVLIGHPGSQPWQVFNRSVRRPGWRRRIGIQPFCPGDARLQAATDRVIPFCDRFLAICGRWWFERTAASLFRHWLPKLIHLDLAVDRSDFPRIKTRFAPPGQRRCVYIGHSAWYKQPHYLCQLARARPGTIAWIGGMRSRFSGPTRLGTRDFTQAAARAELSGFDYLLTVGNADANPTTILEAMAWGLIPVATPESGYGDVPSVLPISGSDHAAALATLDRLQALPESELLHAQAANDALLDRHYHWQRFCAQVVAAVTGTDSPPVAERSRREVLAMRLWELRSPHSWLRPRPLRHRLRRRMGALFRRG